MIIPLIGFADTYHIRVLIDYNMFKKLRHTNLHHKDSLPDKKHRWHWKTTNKNQQTTSEPIVPGNPKPLTPETTIINENVYIDPEQFKPFVVCAMYDYDASEDEECGFVEGDLLKVLYKMGQWWMAENIRTKKKGIIPSNYVVERSEVVDAWYEINRAEAERKLLMLGVESGHFILRPCAGKLKHVVID